ncbi:TorD/DmsD family molecular chaperone [Bradyrhizobium canariense]|jgi:TorA maturation chaperone TorD|uniref:TorD/DmsD family molecular chaperone n=1 Tax=Bradyrhizobium canariense TaxID=255045 RepID=UPI000A18E73B|nr:molecular chaperone TorD family protein [Bradyrhizobium canariense]OSI23805.1 molecular chaperone TorD [Bradyrhizobium canariense]OSI30938.1 molecular chaperone TorD [Bradyrhizobium canariense]OSI39842.1 molecular chaperone TorD [Bradyrhizobium canariense]OSI48132.1 molecular chaperone TorD [Bradyrhizobium canariense]OSI50017.1 molecular chaperone TorD [Bradyrhizobium canariense]
MRERTACGSDRHVVDELDRARAREYALLANLLAREPSRELLGRLSALEGDATPLGTAHAALAEAARRSSEAGAAREYFDVFVGLGRGQILPYASQYLTGSLYGRPLVELREAFQLLGIERVNPSEPEDHIATLCETMAGLVGGAITGPDGCDRDFFAKHLATWARRFFADLERAHPAVFYVSVGSLGRAFVEIETGAYSLPA